MIYLYFLKSGQMSKVGYCLVVATRGQPRAALDQIYYLIF